MQEFSQPVRRFGSSATPPQQSPRVIAVVGGKSRVGTSTVAANTAIALAQWGQRVVLVDANLCKPDLTHWYAPASEKTLWDIADRSKDIHEVLQRGPAGMQFLAGAECPQPLDAEAQQHVHSQFRSLGRHVETVVIDLGHGPQEVAEQWADAVLVVSSIEQKSILGSYAVLKSLEAPPWQAVVVNLVGGSYEAEPITERLRYCSQVFLGRELHEAGFVLNDPQVSQAQASGTPLLLFDAESPAAQGMQQLAGLLAATRFHSKQTVGSP